MIQIQKSSTKAFSMIEIMISIFIFTIGLLGIYAIIISTMRVNDYNKNHIIASNLAREQLELIRNIRDTNYDTIHNYNQINPISNTDFSVFETGAYYKIENKFNSTSDEFPIEVKKITDFGEFIPELTKKMLDYQLCFDKNHFYTYDCRTAGNKPTGFYRYIKIEEVKDANGKLIKDSIKIISKVIWYRSGMGSNGVYNEFEINTILADWKRL